MAKNYLIKCLLLSFCVLSGKSFADAEHRVITHQIIVDSYYIKTPSAWQSTWNGYYQIDVQQQMSPNVSVSGSAFVATLNSPSSFVSDWQGLSNIETDDPLGMTSLFINYQADDVRWMIGSFDENSEFAALEVNGQFINSSMGYSPSLNSVISYPEAATGALFEYQMTPRIAGKVAYVTRDLTFGHESQHVSAQLDWTLDADAKVAVGVVDGTPYVIGESDVQTLGTWLLRGYVQWSAHGGQSLIENHQGIGIVLQSINSDTQLGWGYTNVAGDHGQERVWELYAQLRLHKNLILQPDVQWIKQQTIDDTWQDVKKTDNFAFTLRMVLNW